MFWRISDNDKLALTAMNEADRASAWEMVEQKMLSDEPTRMGAPDGPAEGPDMESQPEGAMPDGLADGHASSEPRA